MAVKMRQIKRQFRNYIIFKGKRDRFLIILNKRIFSEGNSLAVSQSDMSEALETLFGSKAKTRLLRFFLMNPEKQYSAAEIARKNMLSPAVVKKEINDLKKIKFIFQHSRKSVKYYALDQSFHLFYELKSLFAKSSSSPQCKSLAKLKNIGDVKLALISGTFLNYPKSKVDMVLVANNVNRNRLKNVMNSLEAEVGKEISFVLMTSEEFKYRVDMLDRFLLDFIEGAYTELINKIPGFKRIILGKKKY